MSEKLEISREIYEALKAKKITGIDMEATYYLYPNKVNVPLTTTVLPTDAEKAKAAAKKLEKMPEEKPKETVKKEKQKKKDGIKITKTYNRPKRKPNDLIVVTETATYNNLKGMLTAVQKERWGLLMTAYSNSRAAVPGKTLAGIIQKKTKIKNGSEIVNTFITKGLLKVVK